MIVQRRSRDTKKRVGHIGRRIAELVWGTDKRRTVFVTVVVLLVVGLFISNSVTRPENIILIIASTAVIGLLLIDLFWGVVILIVSDIVAPSYVVGLTFNVPLLGSNIPFSKLLGLFLILSFLLNYAVTKKRVQLGIRTQFFFLYLFTIVGVMSSFNAFHLGVAKLEVMRLFLLAIFYIITFNLINDYKKLFIFYAFVLLAVFFDCFRAMYEAFVLHVARPTGGTGKPGALGLNANLGFALLLVLFLELKDRLKRSYCFIGLLITSTAIFISNNRSGFVALVFTLIFQFIRKRNIYIYYAPVIIVLVALLNIIPNIYTYRPGEFITRVYERGVSGLEREPRYALYKSGVDIFLSHPLLGIGPWSFREYYMKEYAEKYHGPRMRLVPHSGILGLLAEFGFFAFVFFAGYVITSAFIFRKSAKLAEIFNRPRERIAVLITEAMFWAFFVRGIFGDIAGHRLAYVLPAIGAAMYYRLLKDSKVENEGAGNSPAVTD